MTAATAWTIAALAAYVASMALLERRAARAPSAAGGGLAGFAAGAAEVGPLGAGLAIASMLASTATFSINPGFVYAEGLPALLGFSLPVALGVAAALLLLGPAFRASSFGPDGAPRALTLAAWAGDRFESPALRRLLSLLVLALQAYVVLVVVGAAYVIAETLGVPVPLAAALVTALALADTLRGGAASHARVNAAQGAILVGAALLLGGAALLALSREGGAALARLREADASLFAWTRPGSRLFGSAADAYALPFAIGFALGCQPHILGKLLLARDRRAAAATGAAAGALFLAISLGALAVGLAARADLGPDLPQDRAAAAWIARALPAPLAAVAAVALVAAAVSTLDGLLLALGVTLANDLGRPLLSRLAGAGALDRRLLLASRAGTALVAALGLAVALDPPRLVWVTGALGAYGLVAAACPVVVAGCLPGPRAGARWALAAAAAGPALHAALTLGGWSANPNRTGAAGLALGLAVAGAGALAARVRAVPHPAPSEAASPTPAAPRSRADGLPIAPEPSRSIACAS